MTLQVGEAVSDVFPFNLATRLATDLHPVANPVVAPDGTIITTISGARGQQVPQPLIRVTRRGDKIPYQCEITNPTGLAFSKDGQLYISSRHDGTVLRYTNFEQLEVFAEDLGVPCGMVFDSNGIPVRRRQNGQDLPDRSFRKQGGVRIARTQHFRVPSGDRRR